MNSYTKMLWSDKPLFWALTVVERFRSFLAFFIFFKSGRVLDFPITPLCSPQPPGHLKNVNKKIVNKQLILNTEAFIKAEVSDLLSNFMFWVRKKKGFYPIFYPVSFSVGYLINGFIPKSMIWLVDKKCNFIMHDLEIVHSVEMTESYSHTFLAKNS